MKRSPVFDLGGGVVIRDRWVLGASFDRSTESAPADVALTLEHPGFHPTLTARRVTDSLERVETCLHINLGYKVPIGDSLSLTIFAGPSYLTRRQELLSDLSISEPFNPTTRTFSAVINSVETKNVRSSAWGYNVGADASYFMSRHVGVGGQIRYARATFDTENFLQSEIDGRTATDLIDGGGLRLAAGVRLRF